MHRTGVMSQRLVLKVVHMARLDAETCCCDLSPSHLCPVFTQMRKLQSLQKIVNGAKKKTNPQIGLVIFAKIVKIRNLRKNRNSCRGFVFSSFSAFCDFNGFCENCEFFGKSQDTEKLGKLVPTRVAILTIFAKNR